MWLSLFRFSIFSAFTTFDIRHRLATIRKQWKCFECVCFCGRAGWALGREATTKLPSVNANFVVRTFEMSETHVFEYYIYHHNINVNKSEAKSKSRRRRRRLKTLTSINLNLLFNFLATKVHSHAKHPQTHTRRAMSGWYPCSKKAEVYLSRLFMWYCDSDYYCNATITFGVCMCDWQGCILGAIRSSRMLVLCFRHRRRRKQHPNCIWKRKTFGSKLEKCLRRRRHRCVNTSVACI